MPRPRREDYEGAWQHVMNRGIDWRQSFAATPIVRSSWSAWKRQPRGMRSKFMPTASSAITTISCSSARKGSYRTACAFCRLASPRGSTIATTGMGRCSGAASRRCRSRTTRISFASAATFIAILWKRGSFASRQIGYGRVLAPTSAPRERQRGFARMQYSRCSGRQRGKSTEISSLPRWMSPRARVTGICRSSRNHGVRPAGSDPDDPNYRSAISGPMRRMATRRLSGSAASVSTLGYCSP
jgi:hypothetical protein